MFNDITALLLRPGVFKDAVDMFVERYRGMGIAAVAGKIIILIRPIGSLASQSCSAGRSHVPCAHARARVHAGAGPCVFL